MSRKPTLLILFFDTLIWLTIVAPLILGGIYWQIGGKDRGLYNASLGAVCVVFLFLILRAAGKIEWHDVLDFSSTKVTLKLWHRWCGFLKKNPAKALFVLSLLFAIIFSLGSLRKHWALKTNAFDLGIFVNALWNLVFNGHYISSFKNGMNLFADHQSPIFWAFAPIFYIYPYAETLLVCQAFILASAGAATYVISKQILRERFSYFVAFVPWVYFLYKGVRSANMFEFHPEVMMLPLFLWGIAGLQSSAWRFRILGILSLLLGLLCKESAGPLLVGVGLTFLLGAAPAESRKFTRYLSPFLIAFGLAVFLFNLKVPKMFEQTYAYFQLYSHLGNSPWEIIFSPFTQPIAFFSHVLQFSRIKYFILLTVPFAFLPLLSWKHIFAYGIPFLILFTPSDDHRLGVNYHYAIEPSIGLFWALPSGFLVAVNFLKSKNFKLDFEKWILIILVLCTIVLHGLGDVYYIRSASGSRYSHWFRNHFVSCFSSEVSVSSPSNLSAQLATRSWSHHLPNLSMLDHTFVDCVITDETQNNWMINEINRTDMIQILTVNYRLIFECQSLKIFQNVLSKKSCQICDPGCF